MKLKYISAKQKQKAGMMQAVTTAAENAVNTVKQQITPTQSTTPTTPDTPPPSKPSFKGNATPAPAPAPATTDDSLIQKMKKTIQGDPVKQIIEIREKLNDKIKQILFNREIEDDVKKKVMDEYLTICNKDNNILKVLSNQESKLLEIINNKLTQL
tara:strand:- start:190 stop:657 length:468 start_codon:yes stop_codon:yes gene_type:complete